MKVGIVLSRPPGNSETFFRNKIIALQQKNISVELFVEKADKTFRLCQQHVLPEKNLLRRICYMVCTMFLHPLRSFRFLKLEFNERNNYRDIIKNFFNNSHLLNSSGLNWIHFGFANMSVGREHVAAALRIKMAVSLRGFDISRYPLRYPGIYRLTWKKADKIHTISNALLQKAYISGLPRHASYSRITPAIDTAVFSGAEVTRMQTPARLLTVGRLHWSKGLEYTLQALSLLQQKGIEFIYTIAGDGKDHERLVLAAHQLGLRGKIIFAGNIDHDRLPEYYSNCDIYIQYSVQEGFCNAALEAQAMGLLCIVSDAEGLPENVINEETGWVVPRRSPELLAEKIFVVLNTDNDTLNRIRENARKRVVSSFNLGKQAMEFVNFYSET